MDGGDLYDTDRFIDIKLSCREQILQKLMDYDLVEGAIHAVRHIFSLPPDTLTKHILIPLDASFLF